MTINNNNTGFTPEERSRLNASRKSLLKRLESLPEKHQRTVLMATAEAGFIRDGREKPDAYQTALAKQMLTGFEITDRVNAAKRELEDISRLDLKAYYPNDPGFPARMHQRRAELEESIEQDQARLIGVAEDGLQYAQREAVEGYRKAAEAARKEVQFQEAIARAEAAAEAADLDRRAAELVAARRGTAGTVNAKEAV